MFTKLITCLLMLIPLTVCAYEFEQPGESSSCLISLSMKLRQVRADAQAGGAVIEVFLREKSGVPIAGKEIEVTASWGTFYCKLPVENDTTRVDPMVDRSCFITDKNGKIVVYLENLMLNEVVKIKAKCDCGGYFAEANGSMVPQKKGKTKK